MLSWLLEELGSQPDIDPTLLSFGQKITFRAAVASMIGFFAAIFLGRYIIDWLRKRFQEPIHCDSLAVARLHERKRATPTMGGLFIVAGVTLATLAVGTWTNPMVWISLLGMGLFCALGAVDDLAKLRSGRKGISARRKIAAQTSIALVVALLIYHQHEETVGALTLNVPFVSVPSLGAWFVPLAVLVIVGSSNAVNLTDGLDGLAGGCLLFAAGAMGVLVYASGHFHLAQYLGIPFIPDSGEMTVVAAAVIGSVLGFLWFNCHPAQVFMGDTGSLPLGGLLGIMAVICRQELLLLIIGGVFVIEAASVMIQVAMFKMTRRRVFRCAPIHHHFQLAGLPESKIVVRFWIASALCAVLGVAVLKITPGTISPEAAENLEKHQLTSDKNNRVTSTSDEIFPEERIARKMKRSAK